jgi:hypothetical protein
MKFDNFVTFMKSVRFGLVRYQGKMMILRVHLIGHISKPSICSKFLMNNSFKKW